MTMRCALFVLHPPAMVLIALFSLACSNSSDKIDFCTSTTQVSFDPRAGLMTPFPSDYYLAQDPGTPTGFRINISPDNLPPREDLFEVYPFFAQQLNALDGFGTSAAIVFQLSAEIGTRETVDGEIEVKPPPSLDLAPGDTTAPGGPIVLMDISPQSPTYGQASPVLVDYLSDVDGSGKGQHFLIAEPAFPLRPQTTYLLALTTNMTDAQGNCIAPSPATQDLLSQGRPEREFGLLGQRIPQALELLESGGYISGPGDISGLTIFTTQSIEQELVSAAAGILERAQAHPPNLVADSLQVTPGTGDIALEVSGKYLTDNFRSQDGTFVVERGQPVIQGQEEVEFELLIPRASTDHPPPYPIIIYQHGLLGNKGQDRGAKRLQARAGFASLSIDAVLHGSRAAPSGWEVTNFFAIDMSTGHFNMPVLRDNFRQTYLDIVQLAELVPALAQLDLLPLDSPDGQVELRAEPVYLSGHSLGAIIAAGAIGLTPRIPAANLCAGGGSLPTNLFMRSELLGSFIDMLKPAGTSDADVRRFMPILQLLVERGDPVNLARLATGEPPSGIEGSAPKHVLFQEVVDDAIVPNEANEALGRALQQGHLEPIVRPVFGLTPLPVPASLNHPQGVSALFFQFDVQSDGSPADHTEIYADELAQQQWIHFFRTHLEGGTAEAIDPYALLGIPHM